MCKGEIGPIRLLRRIRQTVVRSHKERAARIDSQWSDFTADDAMWTRHPCGVEYHVETGEVRK